jgi:hypothetical protein
MMVSRTLQTQMAEPVCPECGAAGHAIVTIPGGGFVCLACGWEW